MVKRLVDRPFTLLGINSDESRSVLQKSIEQGEITWPNIYEGKPREISKQWNVRFFPDTYILDQDGVVRQRGLQGEALEKFLDELLTKAKKE